MSAYNSTRRAPNVSQYIANLNTIPTPQDVAEQATFDLADDSLDFLNTEFFDFDASTFDANNVFASHQQQQPPSAGGNGESGFQYAEFQGYPTHTLSQSPASITKTPSAYPSDFAAQPVTGEKRNAHTAQMQPLGELEEHSRVTAEEDKRRRNTAASARFRVKKKQREQALEKQAKEMKDKVSQLETKVQQLETENKWLKGLITEKSNIKGMDEQLRRYTAQREANHKKAVDAKQDARNDGVGTGTEVEA